MLRATSIKKSNRHKGRREVGGGNCHRSNTAVAVDTIRAGTEANAVAALVIHMLTAIRRGRPISVLSMFRNFMHRAGRGRTVVKRTREGSAHPECEQQAVEAIEIVRFSKGVPFSFGYLAERYSEGMTLLP
jgi:hypothetical protein